MGKVYAGIGQTFEMVDSFTMGALSVIDMEFGFYMKRSLLIGVLSFQIGYGSNKKTRHLMPSGHKAFLVHNPADVDLLLMHNKTFAAEYVHSSLCVV